MPLTPLPVSPLLRVVTLLTILLSLGYGAYSASATAPGLIDSDFKIFRRMAEITRDGHLAQAYDLDQAEALEGRYPTGNKVVPYTYPPLMSAYIRHLADTPPWLGYLFWMVPGLVAFAGAIGRLAGPHAAAIGIAGASAVILNISVGQNGLLIAGVAGVAAWGLTIGRVGYASTLAGCLALKPHLALGLPLGLALRGQWRALALTALVGLGLTAAGFLFYGPEVAHAWLVGTRQASAHLALGLHGAYPIERMVSVYATLRTYEVPHTLALAIHALVAAGALALTVRASLGQSLARSLGFGLIASLFLSPYLYDYDLALLAVALALLVRDGVFDRAPRAYAACLVLLGLLPIPGAFSNWGLLGGLKFAVGGLGLLAVLALCLAAAGALRGPGRDLRIAPVA